MTKIEILEKKPINMAILKEELETIKERDGELSFRANKTEEYVNEFVSIKVKDAKALFEKIESFKIPRLKEEHIHKIIDILPESVEELKVVVQGYGVPISNDNLKKIAEAVADCLPKKK